MVELADTQGFGSLSVEAPRYRSFQASVVELADTQGLGPCARERVWVRVPPDARGPDAVTWDSLLPVPFEMSRDSPTGHILVTVYAKPPSTSAATAAAASPSASGIRWP